MIVDLPAVEFCRSKDIGELVGIDYRGTTFWMFNFHDCWLETDKLFPIAAGAQTCKALFRTYADHKYGKYYSPQFATQLRSHAAFDYDNVFTLGGVDNYWHFLVDHLAKVPLLRHFDDGFPAVVLGERVPSHFVELVESACRFLNLERPVLVKESRLFLKLRNSFVPCVNDAGPRLRFLREFGASMQTADGGVTPERIFLRRGNVSQRRLQNEGELEEKLVERLGFVAVDPGAMTVLEQINLVKNAKIIVGGHGAALTNLIFASRLSDLVELYVWHPQPFFKAACDHLGVGHHFLQGNPVGPQPAFGRHARWDNQDYTVPVDQLLKLVDAIARRPR